jgi:hypothetical protein
LDRHQLATLRHPKLRPKLRPKLGPKLGQWPLWPQLWELVSVRIAQAEAWLAVLQQPRAAPAGLARELQLVEVSLEAPAPR